ncbi:hypothetical protein R3P38DRAFT_110791 [Favolaschia claudopus]|uniref:DUF6699 domain-containing protein n=1 Tax=Favolaschia claudopus TaxID=2862362 RepID=A0AAV9ZXV0_9AGAR
MSLIQLSIPPLLREYVSTRVKGSSKLACKWNGRCRRSMWGKVYSLYLTLLIKWKPLRAVLQPTPHHARTCPIIESVFQPLTSSIHCLGPSGAALPSPTSDPSAEPEQSEPPPSTTMPFPFLSPYEHRRWHVNNEKSSPSSSWSPPTVTTTMPPPRPLSGGVNDLISLPDSGIPYLLYDLSLPPSTISTTLHKIPSSRLREPAIYPPRLSITLVHPNLPWSFTILARPGSAYTYVSIADIFAFLYAALRINATANEFVGLPTDELMRRVAMAYRRRYERLWRRDSAADAQQEQAEGLKRVDFLLGATRFLGIAPISGRADVWQLQTT